MASDLATYSSLVDELAGLPFLDGGPRSTLAQAAVALHHAYGAIESALARIARLLEDSPPEGPDWHQALSGLHGPRRRERQACGAFGGCLGGSPQIVGFRHFFRHAYGVDLDGLRLEELRQVAVSSRAVVLSDLKRFDSTLAALADQ